MTEKIKKNLDMIHRFIYTEAPVTFERVCIACSFSPSKLYSYIPLIKEAFPWITYDNKRFSFDLFIYTENNPDTHSTQKQQTNKQTKLEEEKEVEK